MYIAKPPTEQVDSITIEVNLNGCGLYYMIKSVKGTTQMVAGWNNKETKALLGVWGDVEGHNHPDGVTRTLWNHVKRLICT